MNSLDMFMCMYVCSICCVGTENIIFMLTNIRHWRVQAKECTHDTPEQAHVRTHTPKFTSSTSEINGSGQQIRIFTL